MENKVLPIGSIVKLKDDDNKIVIIGYDVRADNKTHKYTALPYPFGYNSQELFFLFNDEDIENVIFEGYKINNYELVEKIVCDHFEKQSKKEGEVNE